MPGKWHNKMEAKFPEDMREVKFFCSSKILDNVCRRADILLNDRRTLEIQHSHISGKEIEGRFNNWNKFGKEIIWLIDGNTDDVICEHLSTGNYLLIFNKTWKYNSFVKTYDYVLLETKGKVFKIELKKIKSKMIELKEWKSIDDVIYLLKTKPENIWDYWKNENVVKCKLTIWQQGAGNGKTFGIWKSIAENIDKKTFIIVTKQHSAKNVIYEELKEQTDRNEYHIENITGKNVTNTAKHFVIKYTHNQSERECIVIIGTIDSFCFNLSGSGYTGPNFFTGILKNIKENGAIKVSQYGHMFYGGQSIFINKQTEIWIDEVQDLPNDYLYAMTRLMLDTQCDVNIVGDKLQTLEHEDNFLTSIGPVGLPNIKIIEPPSKNINRRISVKKLHIKINDLIKFDKYDLPKIKMSKIKIPNIKNQHVIEIIESPAIYSSDRDDDKVNNYVNLILESVDFEVKEHNYTPENFMFVFPIMKDNIIASELQTKLQEYWIQKFSEDRYLKNIHNKGWRSHDHGNYTQYVYLHKHVDGVCINTNESIYASRIMSIRTSKGDGRDVVFILGTTEQSLKMVSNKKIGLVYESHLHVALTRAKKKVYFGLVKNHDEIHKRFGESGLVEFVPNIRNKISLEKIIQLIDKNKITKILLRNGILQSDFFPEEVLTEAEKKTKEETSKVDWGYHCIKYTVFFFRIILNIVTNRFENSDYLKSHLHVVLNEISNLNIIRKTPSVFYEFLNKNQYSRSKLVEFPLCDLSKKPQYERYCETIKVTMKKIQKDIKNYDITKLSVYESIILIYMIQIHTSQKLADMTPTDLYNVTDFFEGLKSLQNEEILSKLKNIDDIIESMKITNKKSIWNIFKHIRLFSNNEDFKINKLQFPVIGNTDKEVSHIILKPDFTSLNFWDTIIEVLLERFLIYNPDSQSGGRDIYKYKNKKINTFIFILEESKCVKIDWRWDKKLKPEVLMLIKKAMIIHYSDNHKDIYKYLMEIKDKKNKNKKWGDKCETSTPFEYISKTMKKILQYPHYLIKFFEDLHEKWCHGYKKEVKNIYIYKETFINYLNKKLEVSIDCYLGISKIIETDDDF